MIVERLDKRLSLLARLIRGGIQVRDESMTKAQKLLCNLACAVAVLPRLFRHRVKEETALVSRFNETLDKIPVYRGDLQRSLFFEDAADVQEFLIDYTPGETIKYSEFISTTKGKNQYTPDGQVQILIRDSQNGRDISSINDSEQEVVYKTDSEFVVIDVTESDGKYYIWMEEK